MTVEVVLVQHADKQRVPGDPDLTELGVQQAHAVATQLASSAWDALVSSPLRRALHTAEIIGDACGLVPRIDDRLRERMSWGDAPEPQTFAAFLADWRRAARDRAWTPPSGHSSHDTGRRVGALLDELATADRWRLIAVTHGGATVDGLRTLLGDAAVERLAPGCIDDGIPSCALTRLRHDGGRWIVDSLAETA